MANHIVICCKEMLDALIDKSVKYSYGSYNVLVIEMPNSSIFKREFHCCPFCESREPIKQISAVEEEATP